jgi:putative SOS response-associated peptidase YedK
MCGRLTITSPASVIAEVFGVDPPLDFPPRYNVAPGDVVPIVRLDREKSHRELATVRWGLIPWWAKDPKIA